MTIIDYPALSAAGFSIGCAMALWIVADMELIGLPASSLRVLSMCMVALVCLIGIVASVFWPVVKFIL